MRHSSFSYQVYHVVILNLPNRIEDYRRLSWDSTLALKSFFVRSLKPISIFTSLTKVKVEPVTKQMDLKPY